MRRQKAMKTKGRAFLIAEGSALVEPGIQQQLGPVKTRLYHAAVCLISLEFLTHCGLLLYADLMPVFLARSRANSMLIPGDSALLLPVSQLRYLATGSSRGT
jgi:hypothetical protein